MHRVSAICTDNAGFLFVGCVCLCYRHFLLFYRRWKDGDLVMALTKIREGENFESAFRRFKKSCEKAGILSDVKKKEHFEKPSVRLKKKSIAARKRSTKKTRKFEVT